MNPGGLFWIIVGGTLATGFASVGARALRQFSRHDLEVICRRRKARDLFGEILREHDRVVQGVESLVVTLTTLVVVAATYWIFITRGTLATQAWPVLLLATLCCALVLLAVKLWIPWAIVRLWAEPFLFHTWRIWQLVSLLMAPPGWCARAVDLVLHRLSGRAPEIPNGETFEEEIRAIVTEGHREGLLEEDAREMIEGVIELRDADVLEIMTPRTDMHMIHVGLSWEKMLEYVIELGHTRIPVYDKNRDDVIGILYSKDLLPELAQEDQQQPRRPWRDILRRAHFVPETKAVDDLLQEFQKTRNHMAIVLDEYGGVSGLVTIEDVLEEIVGEIVDEYDPDLIEEIRKVSEFVCEALGRAHIDEINEQMRLDLPEDGDFETIAGFVFGELGRVPTVGESLLWQDKVRITVLEATARRIERLRIELVDEASREIA